MNTDLVNRIIRFRVDLLGTSEDSKPSDVPNGSTFYEVDTYKFFIKWGTEWVEQNAESTDDNSGDETPADNEGGDDTPPAENNER